MTRILWCLLLLIGGFARVLHAELMPESVRLFHNYPHPMPIMAASGHIYGGLNRCKPLARQHDPQPFFALPSDVGGAETCDTSRILFAYHGWCTAGVEDRTGPHFTQPL
jgi:hypothetical protein